MPFSKIAFVASEHPDAKAARNRLEAAYPHASPREADVIVALGGDGFMLETLHRFMARGIPIFGMNRGSVGFLMNTYKEEGLIARLSRVETIKLNPLRMTTWDAQHSMSEA